MKISAATKYFGLLLIAATTSYALAAPQAKPLKPKTLTARERFRSVKVLYASQMKGDRGFNRRLMRELTEMDFAWTRDKTKADAFVQTRGDWKNGAFEGTLTIRDRGGKVLWSEQARRPQNSNLMAYQRLADKLRIALGR